MPGPRLGRGLASCRPAATPGSGRGLPGAKPSAPRDASRHDRYGPERQYGYVNRVIADAALDRRGRGDRVPPRAVRPRGDRADQAPCRPGDAAVRRGARGRVAGLLRRIRAPWPAGSAGQARHARAQHRRRPRTQSRQARNRGRAGRVTPTRARTSESTGATGPPGHEAEADTNNIREVKHMSATDASAGSSTGGPPVERST